MKHLLLAILFLFCSFGVFSQTYNSDDITGTYMTEKNDAMLELFKRNSKYYGKVLWTNVPNELDKSNPDEKQRTDKVVGKEILKDFDFDGKNVWHKGTIYDPESGKTYSCKITRDEKGNLNVRGFVGVSLLGKTAFWVKVK